jgi:hypothetical protein
MILLTSRIGIQFSTGIAKLRNSHDHSICLSHTTLGGQTAWRQLVETDELVTDIRR